MRRALAYFLGGAMCCTGISADATARPSRQNVLLIIADDLNCDLGCYGKEIVRTPNLDALASASVRFDRAYVQYPVCNPSRSSFLTGLTPDSIKVFNNDHFFRKTCPDAVTLPQLLRRKGLFTAAFGKVFHRGVLQEKTMQDPLSWDLHEPGKINPGGNKGEGRDLAPGQPISLKWVAVEGDGEDQIDAQIAADAIEFLESRASEVEPFFLTVGFHRPHVPLQCPRSYFDLYPLESMEWPSSPRGSAPACAFPDDAYRKAIDSWTDRDRKEFMRGYYACVSFLDAQVEKLLAALDRLHLDESTLIVFLGDQGFHLGEQGWWNKNTLFESSLRVPLLIRSPGMKGNGQTCHALVELVDLYPTIADLCGVAPPDGLAGVSLRSLLEDPALPGKRAARSMVRRGENVIGRSIRAERWRYTEWNHGELGVELYDCADGSAPEIDRSKDPQHEKTRAELAQLLRETWTSTAQDEFVPVLEHGHEASSALVHVSQPILVGESVRIGEVTYSLSTEQGNSPEIEARLTVAPTAGGPPVEGKEAASPSTMSGNHNAASLFQLRLSFPEGSVNSSGVQCPGLFGDTLVVVMDLSEGIERVERGDGSIPSGRFNEVVGQTVQCLLQNARRSWPRIKHLALSIDGSHAYEHWEGVHSLESVVFPPAGQTGQ